VNIWWVLCFHYPWGKHYSGGTWCVLCSTYTNTLTMFWVTWWVCLDSTVMSVIWILWSLEVVLHQSKS